MKKLLLGTFAFFVLSLLSTTVSAQKPTAIRFARGTHETVVTGTLNGYKSKRVYTIRVGEGQTITTENVGKNYITISIEPPPGSTYEQDMAADCHDRNEVTPTAKGDYKITVTECGKADPWKGTFKFKVTVN